MDNWTDLSQALVENSHFGNAKTLGLNDRKQVRVDIHIDLFTIVQPQELSSCQNGNFQLEVGITGRMDS